jgi:hypothetical protein
MEGHHRRRRNKKGAVPASAVGPFWTTGETQIETVSREWRTFLSLLSRLYFVRIPENFMIAGSLTRNTTGSALAVDERLYRGRGALKSAT